MLYQNTDTASLAAQKPDLHLDSQYNKNSDIPSIVESKQTFIKLAHEKVKNYLILNDQKLGEGSFSQVYKALVLKQNIQSCVQSQNLQLQSNQNNIQHQEQEQVAIKIILKSKVTQDLKQLLQSQIMILKIIKHENVVKCLEVFQDQDRIFIVTQLCNQGDLERRIDTKGKIQEKQAISIIKDVFQGLKYLNSLNIIHRDLKIANIFMHNGKAKIADFGFAIINTKRKPFQDINIGSPIYMSPQGIKHHMYGPATDIWSFGIVIYELLHGRTPYSHCKKQKQLKYNISVQIGWNTMSPTVSYGMKQIIMKCLQISYQKRITIQELSKFPAFKQQSHRLNENLLQKKKFQKKSLMLALHQEQGNNKNFKLQRNHLNNQQKIHKRIPVKQFKHQKQTNILNFNDLKNQNKYKIDLKCRLHAIGDHKIKQTSKTQTSYFHKQVTQQPHIISFVKRTQANTQNSKGNFIACIPKSKRRTSPSPSYQVKKQLTKYQIFQQKYHPFKQNPQKIKTQTNYYQQLSTSLNFKGINQIQYSSLSPKTFYQQKQQKAYSTRIDSVQKEELNFSSNKIKFYLYLIHFSRLCYKISTLHLQLTKDLQVQNYLMSLCMFILESTQSKLNHFLYKQNELSKKQAKQLNLIKQTTQKYISKYKIHAISHFQLSFLEIDTKIKKVFQKLERQCQFCIQDLLNKKKYFQSENVKRSLLKLQYLVLYEGFKSNINQVKCLIFKNEYKRQQNSKKTYVFDHQINNLIKNLQKNIQDSQNKNLDIAKYLKMRKSENHNFNIVKFS